MRHHDRRGVLHPGLCLPLALLLGAILVVTGPTVVIPLLRHVRPKGRIGSIVKWEGILNDPIGALLAKEHAAVFEPKSEHGSTFGGNALTCAAANASTRYIIDNDISGNARDVGEYLMAGLRRLWDSHDFITDVRGMGLLIAVEFSSEMSAEALTACNNAGLLLNAPRPTAIRLMPPLTVTREEVDTALERLEAGLVEAAKVAAR